MLIKFFYQLLENVLSVCQYFHNVKSGGTHKSSNLIYISVSYFLHFPVFTKDVKSKQLVLLKKCTQLLRKKMKIEFKMRLLQD